MACVNFASPNVLSLFRTRKRAFSIRVCSTQFHDGFEFSVFVINKICRHKLVGILLLFLF